MLFDQKAVNQRVIKYAKSIGINDTELGKLFGVKKQFVTEWKENTGVIPAKRLIEFLGGHRELNIRWFLFGEGEMYTKENSVSTKNNLSTSGIETNMVQEQAPLYEKNYKEVLVAKEQLIKELKADKEFLQSLLQKKG